MAEETSPETITEQLETKLRKELRDELEPIIRVEYEGKLDLWKTKELVNLEERQTTQIEGLFAKYVEKLAEESKPPSDEDLEKLLNQDYIEFPVKLKGKSGEVITLTISELPMDIEQKFYKQFKSRILSKLQEVASITQSTMDLPYDQRIKSFLEAFEDAFDVLADACVLILNPTNKEDGISREWCKLNLSSMRMWNIIQAQIKVNRLRDFFSQISNSGNQMTMIAQRPTVQLLQQLQAR